MGSILAFFATSIATTAGYFNRDRELDLEMVKISLSILSGENKDSSAPGRRFALRSLEKYSGVEIPPDDFNSWVQNGTVPEIPWLTTTRETAAALALMGAVNSEPSWCDYFKMPDCRERFKVNPEQPKTPTGGK